MRQHVCSEWTTRHLQPGYARVAWLDAGSPDEDTLARWLSVLDTAERTRADRFRFPADRNAYVAAHALLRHVLAEAAGLAPAYWRFVSGPFEKPRIDPATCQPDLRFNISHTRGLAAVAVCLEHEIGVDVEAASRMLSWHEIARLNFVPREIQLLEQMPSEERFRTFLRLWTLKESYIKATGLGLGCRLNSFAFTLDPVQITTDEPGAEIADTWQFFELDPTPNHLLAGAIQQGAGAPLTIQARALAPQDV